MIPQVDKRNYKQVDGGLSRESITDCPVEMFITETFTEEIAYC